MSEAMVVNLFFTVRVFLVAGLLLLLPRIIRKGLLFGVYVGEEVAMGSAAEQLQRFWRRGCLCLALLSLAIGLSISWAGRPVTGNLTGTVILLCSALAFYLYVYSRARKLILPPATRQASKAVASLEVRGPRETGFAKLSLGLCVFTSLAVLAYAVHGLLAMPDQVPAVTETRTMVDKSIITFLFMPCLNLVIAPFYALFALLIAGAKRALRDGMDSRSVEAQEAFRAINVRAFSWIALLICAFLSLISVQIVRIGLAELDVLWPSVLWPALGMLAVMVAFLIRIIRGHGQGGSFREYGSEEARLTGGLADNKHWVGGLFYVDRDDPSLMIEKRFGLGYGFNYGNRNAVLIVATFVVLIAGFIGLAMFNFGS